MNEMKIDTRTDNPFQIGDDLLDGCGFFPQDYKSLDEAAENVVRFYTESKFKLVDYDGENMTNRIGAYVRRVLESTYSEYWS
jgi:hypothetical protein